MSLREDLVRALRGDEVERFPFAVYSWLLDAVWPGRAALPAGVAQLTAIAPYRIEHDSARMETVHLPDGGELTTWRTPVGDLQQRQAREHGYESLWTVEHAVKRPEDWRVIQYLVEDTHYLPYTAALESAVEQMGEQGLVMAAVERMPFQRLWIEFGDLEQLCVILADERAKLDRLVSLLTRKAAEAWAIVARSGAEWVWAPDNVTADVLSPGLYERYAQPYYEALAEVVHPAGQRIVAHMDGHLAALEELIARTPVDVIESFTPPPNGNLSLGRAWRAWPDKVLWVNFPPSAHLDEPSRIRARMRELAAETPERRRLAFEVSENVPLSRAEENLAALAQTLEEC